MMLVALSVALSTGARFPFGDLSDSTAVKYLGVALFGESGALVTILLLVPGFLAVATFCPELEDRSVFFMYEQPVPRERYVVMKLLNGAFHTVLATAFAVFFAPVLAYALMLLSGKVTLAGSLGAFATVLAASARGALWCSLLSLAAFTGSAMIAAFLPRWWLATAGSVGLIVLSISAGNDFFDFLTPAFETAEQVTVGIGFGSPQWLTITRALPLNSFATLRALPMVTALLMTLAFSAVTGLLYTRKELK
jgi:hypothetical protein